MSNLKAKPGKNASRALYVRSPGDMAEAGTNAFVAVPIAVLLEWQERLHAAFDLGVKAAGGSIIPDRSDFVEIALTRAQINELARLAEENIPKSAALRSFLEVVSIHRSRK